MPTPAAGRRQLRQRHGDGRKIRQERGRVVARRRNLLLGQRARANAPALRENAQHDRRLPRISRRRTAVVAHALHGPTTARARVLRIGP